MFLLCRWLVRVVRLVAATVPLMILRRKKCVDHLTKATDTLFMMILEFYRVVLPERLVEKSGRQRRKQKKQWILNGTSCRR